MSVETDMRMFAQRGCFSIHGSGLPPLETLHILAPYLTKFEIPAELVPKVAEEIVASGFSEGDIYPGLDYLAAELVRTSPLPAAWRASRH